MTTEDIQAEVIETQTSIEAGDTADRAAMAAAFQDATKDEVLGESQVQLRGEDGKFAAAEKAVDKVSLEGEKVAETIDSVTPAVGVSAPAHLPQAIKADWEKIPEAARNAIVAQQIEVDKKFSEVGRQLAQVKPIADRLTHALSEFPEFSGRTPDQLAQGAVELAAVQARLERNPASAIETILEIADHYGVLQGLATRMGGQVAQSGGDENLRREIQSLKQQIAESRIAPEAINQQVSQALEMRSIETEVNAFAADTAVAPYFADIQDDLPHFIARVKKASPDIPIKEALQQAYDMATNADPKVRQKMRDDEARKATTSAVDTKRTDAAKKAASINVKPTVNGKQRELTDREAMSLAFREATA